MRKRFSALGSRLAAGWPLVLVSTLMLAPEVGGAQRPQRALPPAQRTRQRPLDSMTQRADLEMQVRRNFARLVRQRVGLSDDQMRRLVPLTQRYEQQRRQLQIDERDARTSLRRIMVDEATADPKQVDQLLQRLVEVPKRRAQLLESENRELGEFMTPVQRAKFMAIQDQIRRRLEQMRQRRVP